MVSHLRIRISYITASKKRSKPDDQNNSQDLSSWNSGPKNLKATEQYSFPRAGPPCVSLVALSGNASVNNHTVSVAVFLWFNHRTNSVGI